jgi:hypothetical protein
MSCVNYMFLSFMGRFYILCYMLLNYYLKHENSCQYTKVRGRLKISFRNTYFHVPSLIYVFVVSMHES